MNKAPSVLFAIFLATLFFGAAHALFNATQTLISAQSQTKRQSSDEKSAYEFGKECGQRGVPADANPYQGARSHTEEARQWLQGWSDVNATVMSPEPPISQNLNPSP